MPKLLFLLAFCSLVSCATDPLEVETIDVDETADYNGLVSPEEPPGGEGWEEQEGVLRAGGPASLTLLPEHGAVTASFAFRTGDASQATLLLAGASALTIPQLTLTDSAVRRSVATITPGVWQDLEVAYQPGQDDAPPLLVAAYLNGNLLYYQEPLPDGAASTGSGMVLQVDEGPFEVTDFRSLDRAGKRSVHRSNGEVELHLPIIRYAYYDIEGTPDDVTNWGTLTPDMEGYIGRFDLAAIREEQTGYAVRFTAELDIPKADEYTFAIFSPARTRLYIDDQAVIAVGDPDQEQYVEGAIRLSEGSHELRLDHYQNTGWNRLNVSYLNSDGEAVSLNDLPNDRAVATPPAGETLALETDDRPYLLRSFLNFPPVRMYDFTEKRTHVVNVGEGDGPHYSYDLQNGSLLQLWRGDFVDVSEMWVGRGEPQVARALGPVVAFDGRPQWATDASGWPEEASDLVHQRYELDEQGRPTFHFEVDGTKVSDKLVPADDGITRTVTNTGAATVYSQVAAGRRIVETAPGAFELRGPGATVEIWELATGGLRILRGAGTERLVAELPAGEHLTYHINW